MVREDLLFGSLFDSCPETWDVVPFEEAIDFQEGPGIMAVDFHDTGVPLIRLSGVQRRTASLDGCNFLDPEKVAKKWNHFRLKCGDLLISTSATIGMVSEVGPDTEGAVAYTGLIRLRPRTDKVFPGFIKQFASSTFFIQQAQGMAAGSVLRHFGPSHLRQMAFPIPPIAEQKAIAGVLGALDDKIELNRRMNATLEAMARALFQSWFVDFDPVRDKLDGRKSLGIDATTAALFPLHLQETTLGKVPTSWDILMFADVLTLQNSRVGDDSVPEFSATVTGLSARDERFKKQLSKSQSKNKRIVAGDLVFGFSREVINFGLMREPVGAVSPVYEVFKINSSIIEPDLLERLFRFNMPYYMDILKPGVREGKPIDRDYLLRKHLLVPSIAVQRAFLATIKPWTERIKTNEAQSRTLATLRDTLLPKLLSGELSVASLKN